MCYREALRTVSACILLLLVAGCGGGGGSTPAVNAAGKHPANWYSAHRLAYLRDKNGCRECHGLPLDPSGGITKINCTTTCHRGGHGPRDVHEIPYIAPSLHGSDAKIDLVYCQYCHGEAGGAGSNPKFNINNMTGRDKGCVSAGCHDNSVVPDTLGHPKPWLGHNTSGNQAVACALCHGPTYGGGAGPACSSCHKRLAVAQLPKASDNCGSCHNNPPDDPDVNINTNYPDNAGSHAKHMAIAGVACSSCHQGTGSGSTTHYEGSRDQIVHPVSVVFHANYNSKQGAASIAGGRGTRTCSNVLCHGGVVTPHWGTPSIDATNGFDCVKCHQSGIAAQTPEYNSFWSGRHQYHVVTLNYPCTVCHLMNASNHFTNLATSGFETPVSATLRGYFNYNSVSCSTPDWSPAIPGGVGSYQCHPNVNPYVW